MNAQEMIENQKCECCNEPYGSDIIIYETSYFLCADCIPAYDEKDSDLSGVTIGCVSC